jgi:hypothetical protein
MKALFLLELGVEPVPIVLNLSEAQILKHHYLSFQFHNNSVIEVNFEPASNEVTISDVAQFIAQKFNSGFVKIIVFEPSFDSFIIHNEVA